MPHIILEISQQFDIAIAKKVIDYSQEFLVDSLPTRLETFKSRVYRYDFSSVGGDDKLDLIHMQIKVLAGREQQHLNNLALELKNQLIDLLNAYIDMLRYRLTLEIIELSPAYAN
ncbi:5-carboxymethyl-2-hydroxymuconate Delta-isomerase [Francisella tularensis subsp. novicida]|uniref:5-carboxymethyl-2-hydroxymuconate Delta-isomerase n=2 Tax=Francisella tularensis TaxID=263 RepID=A0A6I4S162_FRATU|nr:MULTISPECIES: 5-carboxymethyl-2-hydroxymuconate Delta-isomerase [Francisella]AHH46819.1 hypothetical protein X557_07820 [Francisella tularensis subsp. holarctica PHIT-FT049]ABK89523.1 hypothetical protein FTN_0630 [Francisella tularensis subsp. novicida U112]ABO47240.1 hypothetical protein FTW_1521 [Francisella tularensis subsp. tularensis WY96-3418]AJI61712.1 hypothetical protein AW25_1396 [Francisella tularensis subsp. novicida U112]AJI62767.1 hypothetical protein CH65_1297 [Francisella t